MGENKMTAFIVDREAFGGVFPGPPEKKLGIRGSNTCVVTFDNCVVPNENVLGEVHGGFKVAMTILNNGRFGMGAATGGGIRRLLGLAADYANNRIQFTLPISKFGLIQEKFARMASDAYAIESMAYMTTGLIDNKQMDMSIEAAICKIYGSEAMFTAINDCIQILGGMGFSAGGSYPFERLLRDSRILLIFEGTNEILRLFIALTCLQGPGSELSKMMKNLSNPFSLVSALPDVISFASKTYLNSHPATLPLDQIAKEMHAEAKEFQEATGTFYQSVVSVLQAYGKEVTSPQHQIQVSRIANVAIDLYGWMAVLSRVSSALKQQVPSAAHEVLLAKHWIHSAKHRIQTNVANIKAGEEKNADKSTYLIAKQVTEAGQYLAQHPIRV
jgi:acyl-CoA dehydrogenase family protein 9